MNYVLFGRSVKILVMKGLHIKSLTDPVTQNRETIRSECVSVTADCEPRHHTKRKMLSGPLLRFTPPHFLNSPIFPLDTAKNHRVNSILHQYYWQKLFMQLTADNLSHSLLTSIYWFVKERGSVGVVGCQGETGRRKEKRQHVFSQRRHKQSKKGLVNMSADPRRLEYYGERSS